MVILCLCVRAYVHETNLAPVVVVLNTVDRQGDHLDASLLKLPAVLGGAAELGGADGREVPRVGEQDAPSAEGDRAASGVRRGYSELSRLVELSRLKFMIWPRLHNGRPKISVSATLRKTCSRC